MQTLWPSSGLEQNFLGGSLVSLLFYYCVCLCCHCRCCCCYTCGDVEVLNITLSHPYSLTLSLSLNHPCGHMDFAWTRRVFLPHFGSLRLSKPSTSSNLLKPKISFCASLWLSLVWCVFVFLFPFSFSSIFIFHWWHSRLLHLYMFPSLSDKLFGFINGWSCKQLKESLCHKGNCVTSCHHHSFFVTYLCLELENFFLMLTYVLRFLNIYSFMYKDNEIKLFITYLQNIITFQQYNIDELDKKKISLLRLLCLIKLLFWRKIRVHPN